MAHVRIAPFAASTPNGGLPVFDAAIFNIFSPFPTTRFRRLKRRIQNSEFTIRNGFAGTQNGGVKNR
jgi:hypothetical protein